MSELLLPFGWSGRWEALSADLLAGGEPGRVLRHDGVAVAVQTPAGERMVPLRRGIDSPVVGDWVVVDGDHIVGVLERASLLRRRAAGGEGTQLLAANVDLVLLACGLDRPVRSGRIRRGEALAWDAGAVPLLVLTKADVALDLDGVLTMVAEEHPGLEVMVTSVTTRAGLDEVLDRIAGSTSVLLGESGAGKSSLVNVMLGGDVAAIGRVREGDSKGRHTTTNRQLHLLARGGVVIDTPGIREVGLAGDEDSVDATFTDIEELALECRFNDCVDIGEPGCAIAAAIADGNLATERFEVYQELMAEAAAAARRADEAARRAFERQGSKFVREAVRRKGRPT